MPPLPGYQPKSDLDRSKPPKGSALASQSGEITPEPVVPSEIPDLIRAFAKLKKEGLLSEGEFESKKTDLLDRV